MGTGTVTLSPSPGTDGKYAYGTEVILTANPSAGYAFSSWSGDTSGTSPFVTITMNGDKSVTANFIQITYTLTISINGGGTTNLTPDLPHPYPSGTTVAITANSNNGWQFSGWTGDVADPSSPTTTVTMDSNKVVTANFTRQPILTIAVNPPAGGITNPAPGTYPYNSGTTISVTATPHRGYRFSAWSGDASGTNSPVSITVDRDQSITANFAPELTRIDISAELQGGGRPEAGWEIPLTAKFYAPGAHISSDIPLYTFTLTTTKSEARAVGQCPGILPGTYDVTAASEHTLLNVKRNVAASGSSLTIDIGMLLEGNANNDNIINIADFGILSLAYGKESGQPGFDGRADFDRNGRINISDFGLLAINYGSTAPLTVP